MWYKNMYIFFDIQITTSKSPGSVHIVCLQSSRIHRYYQSINSYLTINYNTSSAVDRS